MNETLTRLIPADLPALPASDSARVPGVPEARTPEPFDRVARLAADVLGAPFASVTTIGAPGGTWICARTAADRQSLSQQSMQQHVIDSDEELIIDGTRLDLPGGVSRPAESTDVIAWAGIPIRHLDGRVAGALSVADRAPRNWSGDDVEVLDALALIASGEIALQIALGHRAGRAAWTQVVPESPQPHELPVVPGLQVAARHMSARTGADELAEFYDVFPSVGGRWGLVVGDVSGGGLPAAESRALARDVLRTQARKSGRPSLILAGLNQALLDWPALDQRFLTAICVTVRPIRAGILAQISSAGHPLALVRQAGGQVQNFGRPGTALGLRPDPELPDSRRLLRAGDSLILVSDSVIQARGNVSRDPFGEDRLRAVVAGLGNVSAAQAANVILLAARAFSAGQVSDNAVALVVQAPGGKSGSHAAPWPGTHAYPTAGDHAARRRWRQLGRSPDVREDLQAVR